MATLSMKPEIFITSRFRSGTLPRPKRVTRPTTFIENGSFESELTMAIQESLKIARQNEFPKTLNPRKPCEASPIRGLEKPTTSVTACQTETYKSIKIETHHHAKRLNRSNLELIKYQQDLLNAKDVEIKTLRSENEALQCRLERMERRMSILKQRDDASPLAISPATTPTRPNNKRKQNSLPTALCKRIATTKFSQKKPTPNEKYPSAMISEEGTTTILTSTDEYHVIPCSAVLRSPTLDGPPTRNYKLDDNVEVPPWRFQVYKNMYQMEGTENMTDEAYMRRHQKPELEEKRRKRWDLQRQREQQTHDRLRDKSDSGGVTGADSVAKDHTLYPLLNQISHIQVCDELPVSVFGQPIPYIESSEFELPWPVVKRNKSRKR